VDSAAKVREIPLANFAAKVTKMKAILHFGGPGEKNLDMPV